MLPLSPLTTLTHISCKTSQLSLAHVGPGLEINKDILQHLEHRLTLALARLFFLQSGMESLIANRFLTPLIPHLVINHHLGIIKEVLLLRRMKICMGHLMHHLIDSRVVLDRAMREVMPKKIMSSILTSQSAPSASVNSKNLP